MDHSRTDSDREILMDHSRSPRNQGCPDDFDRTAGHCDVATGDEIELWLSIVKKELLSVHWEAKGSAVLQASCSLMSEGLSGRSLTEAVAFIDVFLDLLTGTRALEDYASLGEAVALAGIRHLPARVRCAVLPWRVARGLLVQ